MCTEILLRWQEEHNPGAWTEEAALQLSCCAALPFLMRSSASVSTNAIEDSQTRL